MAFLHHRLGTTYYVKKGKVHKERLPIIYLHGGPGGTHYLSSPLFKLSNERCVVMYDQLGAKKSKPKSKNPKWTIQLFVDELELLINHLGFKKFHLTGGSWGTTLALEYYLRTKDKRVASINFSSPLFSTAIWVKDCKRLLKQLPKRMQEAIKACEAVGATDSKVYKEADKEFMSRFVCRGDKTKPIFQVSRKNGNPAAYLYMWGTSEFNPTGTLKNYDRLKDLKKIKVPVQLTCGQYDEATPQACRYFQKLIPGSKLVIFKGCSHIYFQEKPQLVLKAYRKWLKYADQITKAV